MFRKFDVANFFDGSDSAGKGNSGGLNGTRSASQDVDTDSEFCAK